MGEATTAATGAAAAAGAAALMASGAIAAEVVNPSPGTGQIFQRG